MLLFIYIILPYSFLLVWFKVLLIAIRNILVHTPSIFILSLHRQCPGYKRWLYRCSGKFLLFLSGIIELIDCSFPSLMLTSYSVEVDITTKIFEDLLVWIIQSTETIYTFWFILVKADIFRFICIEIAISFAASRYCVVLLLLYFHSRMVSAFFCIARVKLNSLLFSIAFRNV